jgi:hypothetical protein
MKNRIVRITVDWIVNFLSLILLYITHLSGRRTVLAVIRSPQAWGDLKRNAIQIACYEGLWSNLTFADEPWVPSAGYGFHEFT